MRFALAVAAGMACTVGACATVAPHTSYIATAAPAENGVMALAITNYLRGQLSPARTTLIVDPADNPNQALIAEVEANLRGRGFAVADAKSGEPNAQHVRLEVSPLGAGYVVRIDYGRQQAGTYFARDTAGSLQATQPFVRRDIG